MPHPNTPDTTLTLGSTIADQKGNYGSVFGLSDLLTDTSEYKTTFTATSPDRDKSTSRWFAKGNQRLIITTLAQLSKLTLRRRCRALSGDVANAAELAKNAAAELKQIAEIPSFLNVQRLKIPTVYVNDAAKPTRALATSEAVNLDEEHKQTDGQRKGFMVFTLEKSDENWSVIDIDFESETSADKELKRFLEANLNSIGLPPIRSN